MKIKVYDIKTISYDFLNSFYFPIYKVLHWIAHKLSIVILIECDFWYANSKPTMPIECSIALRIPFLCYEWLYDCGCVSALHSLETYWKMSQQLAHYKRIYISVSFHRRSTPAPDSSLVWVQALLKLLSLSDPTVTSSKPAGTL